MKSLTPSDFRAIILASGKGSRYGMPKSEATLDGLLFSQLISQNLLSAGVHDIILAKDMDTASMFESLRQSIRKTPQPPAYYIIWPVDHPLVSSYSLSILLETARENPDCIIKPEYMGRRGHPILVPSHLDFQNPVYETLRELIRHSAIGTVIVPVEDPGVLQNINHPADLSNADL